MKCIPWDTRKHEPIVGLLARYGVRTGGTEGSFRWLYRESPWGPGTFEALLDGETLAGICGFVPVMFATAVKRELILLLSNILVEEVYRDHFNYLSLARSAYRRLSREYPRIMCYPNDRAWRVHSTALDWTLVEEARALVGSPEALPRTPLDGVRPQVEPFGEEADALLEACLIALPPGRAILYRSAAYLNWRYRDHPDRCHRVFVDPSAGGRLNGWLAARTYDPGGSRPKTGHILDLLVDPGAGEATLLRLVAAACHWFQREGCPGMSLWISESHPARALFTEAGFEPGEPHSRLSLKVLQPESDTPHPHEVFMGHAEYF